MSDTPYNNQQNQVGGIGLLDLAKLIKSGTSQEYQTRMTNLNDFFSEHVTPSFEHITGSPYTNEELSVILELLTSQIAVNTKEILYLHRLLALLIFELLEQGIEFEHKELYNEVKQYLKYK